MKNQFRIPGITERVAVVGRTGSGKTQGGLWLLSQSAFDVIPYVIVDYKGDEMIGSIDYMHEIDYKTVPKYPGIYRLRAKPSDAEQMEAWLWKVWARERCGLFFDEAYLVPEPARGGAFRAILTQGRSKRVPAIMCVQRPAWISKFIFSEADYFAVFHLSTKDDRDRIKGFIPGAWENTPEFWSQWYDVKKDRKFLMRPVPDADTILDTFAQRLAPKRMRL